jgi:hypothetical protein
MRLGGPIENFGLDPERWVSEARALNYTACYAPVNHEHSSDVAAAFAQAAARAGLVIAESGAWSNPIDPDSEKAAKAISYCQKQLARAEELGARCCVNIAIHLECSGHEQAVLDGCKLVCNRGEVVLVGVPWARRADLQAFDLLHAVFHRYVVLRSGWEWEIPMEARAFAFNSISGNIAAAMDWLSDGSIKVAPLGATYDPADCQKVYSGLLDQSLPTPSAIFDWRL